VERLRTVRRWCSLCLKLGKISPTLVRHHLAMPRDRFPLPDDPPSGRLLPEHERRQRAADLEWMHEAAQPRRKKRVDPAPEPVADRLKRQYREALGGFHELED